MQTAQKMKSSIKDFFIKCDKIRSFLRIWSHLLKKSLMENFIFFEQWTESEIVPFIQENTSQKKLIFWHIFYPVNFSLWWHHSVYDDIIILYFCLVKHFEVAYGLTEKILIGLFFNYPNPTNSSLTQFKPTFQHLWYQGWVHRGTLVAGVLLRWTDEFFWSISILYFKYNVCNHGRIIEKDWQLQFNTFVLVISIKFTACIFWLSHSWCVTQLVPFVQSKKHENTNGESVPLWMFFTFFKLYKWNQIAQSISMLMGTFNAQPAGSI